MAEATHISKANAQAKSSSGGSFFNGKSVPAFFPEGAIQRACDACKEEGKKEKKIQRQDGGAPPPSPTPAPTPPPSTPPSAPPAQGAAPPPASPQPQAPAAPAAQADPAAPTPAPTPADAATAAPGATPDPSGTPPSLLQPPNLQLDPSLLPPGPGIGPYPDYLSPYRLDPSIFTPPSGASSTANPNWFGMTSPFRFRGAGPVSPQDYDAMQSIWQRNADIGRFLLGPDRANWFSNMTTPTAVDNALKTDYPTQIDISNQTTPAHVLPGPTLYFKLEINEPNDPFEQEADTMADKVVQRKPADIHLQGEGLQLKCAECEAEEKKKEKKIQKKAEPGWEPLAAKVVQRSYIQRKCAECEAEEKKKEKKIQKKDDGGSSNSAGPVVEKALDETKGRGEQLSPAVNAEMSSAFGADFSGVSIHTDNQSAQMNSSMNAHAFTHGSDIYFNTGKFDPGSNSGKHLLAHELTHVVQQGAAISRKTKADPDAASGAQVPSIQRDVSIGAQCPNADVTQLVTDALAWLDDINKQLDGYISFGNSPLAQGQPIDPAALDTQNRIADALQQAFNTKASGYANIINERLKHVASVVRMNKVVKVDCAGNYCNVSGGGGATIAYSDYPYHLNMCASAQSTPAHVASFIHELCHAILPQVGIHNKLTAVGEGVRDRAYPDDRVFSYLTPEETLDNAASYEVLAKLLHDKVNSKIVGQQTPTDTAKGCTQGSVVLESFARAAQWNHYALHAVETDLAVLKNQGSQKLDDLPSENLRFLQAAFPSVTSFADLDKLQQVLARVAFNAFGGTGWDFTCIKGNGGKAGAVGLCYAGWITSSTSTIKKLPFQDINLTPDWFTLSTKDKIRSIYALHLISRPDWIVAGINLGDVYTFVDSVFSLSNSLIPDPTATSPQDHLTADKPFPQPKLPAQQKPPKTQPKLAINHPGDPLEKEADDMADSVVQRSTGVPSIQAKCAHCEAEEKRIQRDDKTPAKNPVKMPVPTNASIDEIASTYAQIVASMKWTPEYPKKYIIVTVDKLEVHAKDKSLMHAFDIARPMQMDISGYWVGNPFIERDWFPITQHEDGSYHKFVFSEDIEMEAYKGTDVGEMWKALNKEIDVLSWFKKQEDLDQFRKDIPVGEVEGMAIVRQPVAPAKKGDGKGGKEGPHLVFTLPSWFGDLKKKLDQKIADERKANPEDPLLPEALVYYGSEEVQAQRGADAWTIDIKRTLGKEMKKGYVTVLKSEWDAQADKDVYIQDLENRIKDVVGRLNQNLETKASDAKDKERDKALSAKGAQFAWAVELKDQVWKKLLEIKAQDKDANDIPDKLTLGTQGDEVTGSAYLQVWLLKEAQKSSDPEKSEKPAYKGGTLTQPLNKNDSVDYLVPIVRGATTQLRNGAPPPGFKTTDTGMHDPNAPDVLPAYDAHIAPQNLSPDLNTIPSADNTFRFVIDVQSMVGSNLLAQVTTHMNMIVRHDWQVFNLPADLETAKDTPGTKPSDLIGEANDYIKDRSRPLGDEKGSYGPAWDWDQEISMSKYSYGDYLLLGTGQPYYKDESYKRAMSRAAYVFTVADPKKLAEANTNAESNELARLKAELEKNKDDKTKENDNKAIKERIDTLEKRQKMDLVALAQSDLEDTAKMVDYAKKLKAFIIDDRQHHLSYSGDRDTDPFIVRLHRVDPTLAELYNMIRRQFDPAKYDDVYAIDQYLEGLAKQQDELTRLQKRASGAAGSFQKGSAQYRTVATLVQKDTGNALPLVLQMGNSIKQEDGKYRYTLVDVTFDSPHKDDTVYVGEAESTQAEAVQSAFEKFGKDNPYGKGKITYRVPDIKGASGDSISGEAESYTPWYRYLEYAVMAAGILALILGTVATGGLLAPATAAAVGTVATVIGVTSAVVGAALAIRHLHERSEKGTLEMDADTGMDILNILAAVTVIGSVAVKLPAIAGGVSKLATLSKVLNAVRMANVILVYEVADIAANAFMIAWKVKEDVSAIKDLHLPPEKEKEMIEEVALQAIQQGAMLVFASHGKVKEIAEHLRAKVENARYYSLQERGFLDANNQVTREAPPFMREKMPGGERLEGVALGEANRKEAAVFSMAEAPTKDGQHKVTVTEKGNIIRCSDYCEVVRLKYFELLEREKGKAGGFDERLKEIEQMARDAALKRDKAMAAKADQMAVAIENEMAKAELGAAPAAPVKPAVIPDSFQKLKGSPYRLDQIRKGGATEQQIEGILENYLKQGGDNPENFLDKFQGMMEKRKNNTDQTISNTYKILDGLQSGDKATFETARDLMEVSNVTGQEEGARVKIKYPGLKKVDAMLDVFNLGELGSMTKGKIGNDFVNAIYSIINKVPKAGKVEILELMNKAAINAGEGMEGWARLARILDDPKVSTLTVDQVRGAIETHDSWRAEAKAAMADKKKGFGWIVDQLWGGKAELGEEGGNFNVKTEAKKGTKGFGKELFGATTGESARERTDPIIKSVLDDNGDINKANWFVLHEAITKANVPDIIKNGIIGEFWTRVNFESLKAKGFKPVREVTIHYGNVEARIDIIYFDGNNMVFLECKSGAAELNKGTQTVVYPVIDKDTNRTMLTLEDPVLSQKYKDPAVTKSFKRADEKSILAK